MSSISSELRSPAQPSAQPSDSTPPPRAVLSEEPILINLGRVTAEGSKPGNRVASGNWGDGPDDFGLYRPSATGPTSFDVTPDGRVYIADEQNGRLVVVEGEERTNLAVGLPPLFMDLAVTADEVDVLVVNGGRYGADLLERYGLDGAHLATDDVGDMVGNVRNFNGEAFVYSPQEGWAAPGTPPTSGQGQIPTPTGGLIGLAGGIGRNLTFIYTDSTSSEHAWTLHSDMNLGAFEVAPTRNGVRAVLVHWTNTRRVFQYVELDDSGLVNQFTLSDQHYAEMTANSTFRFSGDTLYRAGSNPTGFSVYAYPLHGRTHTDPAPQPTPQPSSNTDLLERSLRLLESVGVRHAVQAEEPHGSKGHSLAGEWEGRTVYVGVIPTQYAAPPQRVLRTYTASGTTVTVLRSAPYIVHQFTTGEDTWSIVCTNATTHRSDDEATTRLAKAMIKASSA